MVPLILGNSYIYLDRTHVEMQKWQGDAWEPFADLRALHEVSMVGGPSKIRFLIENTIPQKEDRILLYIGYHSIPK